MVVATRRTTIAAALFVPALMSPPSAPSQTVFSERGTHLEQGLSALAEEMKALRGEISQLRQAMADMRIPRRPPAAMAPPPVVKLDDDPALGSADAPLAIVEFSEYQCPFCRRFQEQTFPMLKASYIDTGKVRYVFRDFPLEMHPHAKAAAVAAHCAGRQGAYWPMHDALFSNQERLGPSVYSELAGTLKLDVAALEACIATRDAVKEVDDDFAYARSIGVEGTPHFFIGRLRGSELVDVRILSGAQPPQAFERAINELLGEDGGTPTAGRPSAR